MFQAYLHLNIKCIIKEALQVISFGSLDMYGVEVTYYVQFIFM